VAELKKGHQEQLNKLQADCSCFFAVVRNIAKELNYKIEGDPVNPKQIKIVV
jgi:hypothetical protein